MSSLAATALALQVLAFFIALSVGSFLNVCIARMPEDRSVVYPPSHCPACGAGIQATDNIPVLSWLWLRGKCRSCGLGISALYPVIELLTGVLGLLLWRHFMPAPEAVTVPNMAAWAVYLAFVSMLLASSFIDLRHYIIPDQFSQYAVPFGIAAMAGLGWLGWPGALSWTQALAGSVVGAGSLLSIIGVYWLWRREEGMGLGDVKLLAMIGAFLGALPAIPFVIVVSSVLGSIAGLGLMITQGRGMKTQLPFGPFLALAAVLYVFFGEELTGPMVRTLTLLWNVPSVFLAG